MSSADLGGAGPPGGKLDLNTEAGQGNEYGCQNGGFREQTHEDSQRGQGRSTNALRGAAPAAVSPLLYQPVSQPAPPKKTQNPPPPDQKKQPAQPKPPDAP